jgi:hypothetical protein
LHLGDSSIGLITQMPGLKEMKLSFSGFDAFPSDFDSLKCLSYFESRAHAFCQVDLALLNLAEMKCLKYIEFQSRSDNMNGIPNGIDDIKTVKMGHPNLTKKEKEELKKING